MSNATANAVLNGFQPLHPDSPLLFTWTYMDGTRIRHRNGSAGFLLAHLGTRFDRKVEKLREPILDEWGYAMRAVRGYASVISRHEYGLAIDLNATDHPLGVGHTFTPAEVTTIHKLLETYDGAIRWGGDYTGRLDAMHFEINTDLSHCEQVARRLIATGRGRAILAANPGQKKVIYS